jgi:hypothetical protein
MALERKTRELWRSLDFNITHSIEAIAAGLLVNLEHHELRRAVTHGFARDHKSELDLWLCLAISRNAFIHRLAYLAYVISQRYQWHQELIDQEWWQKFVGKCSRRWVDSVWDVIYRQWQSRNFVGMVVNPVEWTGFGQRPSVRSLQAALNFGVPIWLVFPSLQYYADLDGGFVVKLWEPKREQIVEAMQAEMTTPAMVPMDILPAPRDDPSSLPPAAMDPDPSADAETPSPPANLSPGAQWYRSWEEFVQKCDAAIARGLEKATEKQKTSWESLAQNAKKFWQLGKKGAKVYVWEACSFGGF